MTLKGCFKNQYFVEKVNNLYLYLYLWSINDDLGDLSEIAVHSKEDDRFEKREDKQPVTE